MIEPRDIYRARLTELEISESSEPIYHQKRAEARRYRLLGRAATTAPFLAALALSESSKADGLLQNIAVLVSAISLAGAAHLGGKAFVNAKNFEADLVASVAGAGHDEHNLDRHDWMVEGPTQAR